MPFKFKFKPWALILILSLLLRIVPRDMTYISREGMGPIVIIITACNQSSHRQGKKKTKTGNLSGWDSVIGHI